MSTDPWNRRLPPEEFLRREAEHLASALGPERDAMLEHMDWFRRRYPTPLERLRYVTAQTAAWTAGDHGPSRASEE